jgi:PAS domain S-box-containing protein
MLIETNNSENEEQSDDNFNMKDYNKTVDDLKISKEELEELIELRTEKLIQANQKLQQEILEKQKTEAMLLEERNKFQKYIDIAGIMILVLDKNGTVKLVNKKGCKILGCKEDEIIGKNWFENFIPEEDKAILRNVHFNITNKNIEKFEIFENYIVTKKGEKKLILWNNAVLTDSKGEVIATISSGEDITEKKEAEETIKRMNLELEERVMERTKELEILNKDLESFSYSVSHDLKAPLRHIKGFSELLLKNVDENDSKLKKYAELIYQSSNEMGIMIDKLLEFSRLGRKVLNKTKVDMNGMVKEVKRFFEDDVKDRNIIWDIQTLPRVLADEELLKMAFTNLISNAIKYTSKNEVTRIEVVCYSRSEEKVIYVRDNGVGFDMNYAENMFGVFQRLHNPADFEGTGIGLAMTKRIINKHGGKIWAESKPGKGATLFFTIPNK